MVVFILLIFKFFRSSNSFFGHIVDLFKQLHRIYMLLLSFCDLRDL